MAVFDMTKTVNVVSVTPLHTSAAKKCTVEIIEPRGVIILSRRLNGVVLDGPFFQDFIGLKLGQTIPVGVIRGSAPAGSQPISVSYRVRTGGDVTGTPEFDFFAASSDKPSSAG